MNRRRYLRALGVAGGVTGAGCASLGGSNNADAEYTPDARDDIAVAVGNLNTVALAVSTVQEGNDPRAQDFDETEPRERLAAAEDALAAAAEAEGADVADIEAVRGFATVVTGMVDALVDLLAASDTLEATEAQFEDPDSDVGTAREAMATATETSARAVEARDVAVETSGRVDADRLAALDAAFEDVREGLGSLSGFVTGVDGLTRGYSAYLVGVGTLQRAEAAFDDDAFEAAQTAFGTARTDFDAATGVFSDTRPDTPEALVPDVDLGEQRSLALADLSTGYVALLDGQASLAAAETAFEDGVYDTAAEGFETAGAESATAEGTFTRTGEDPDLFTLEFEQGIGRARALESLADGYATLTDGTVALEDGRAALDDRDFAAAESEFTTARGAFAAADEQLVTGVPDADKAFTAEFERARCRAGHLEAAAGHFEAAARAGRRRNQSEFDSRRERGEAELDGAAEC